VIKINRYSLKNFLILFLSLVFLLIIYFFIYIVKLDWNLGHKSFSIYAPPYNWISYKAEILINKFHSSFININNDRLPVIKIYLDEKSQKKLLSDIPFSTKNWMQGYYLDGQNLKKIQLRHIGKNPMNWYFDKKSWRIKTSKKKLFNRTRHIEFRSPQTPNVLNEYLGFKIANNIDLLSKKIKLIELHLNDINQGVYMQTENLNENFLRRNKVMPVNIYKGEKYSSSQFIGTDNNLFNNPGLWSKNATFNQFDENNFDDLAYFFKLISKSYNNKKYLIKLFDRADVNEWAKFATYQILTQNYHNDELHNMRILSDPWSGKILPILHDPIMSTDSLKNKKALEWSSNSLLRLFNTSSVFISKKYDFLFYYLNTNKVLTNTASKFSEIQKKLDGSYLHDNLASHTKYMLKYKADKLHAKKILSKKYGHIERKKFINALLEHENSLKKFIISKPNVFWNPTKFGFKIHVNGELPVTNININTKNNNIDWVVLDSNYNNKIDKNELKFFSYKDEIKIPLMFFANRTVVSNTTSNMILNSEVVISSTEFNFISKNIDEDINMNYENYYSKEQYNLDKLFLQSARTNKFNEIISLDKKNDTLIDTKIFSGINYINKDTIVHNKSKILPGTKFFLDEGVSLIFKNHITATGTTNLPIEFVGKKENIKPWGTIGIIGHKTNNSIINNVYINGGSGDNIEQTQFTAMLSLHNNSNLKIENLKLENNFIYDDTVHLVYCSNYLLKNITINNSLYDGIDIDMSNDIVLKNININKSGNDGIDFMETTALITNSYISNSGDKGISVGENSHIFIHNSNLLKNNLAVASKDLSKLIISYSNFEKNNINLSAYAKNYQYNGGGSIDIYYSKIFKAKNIFFESDINSKIKIYDSIIIDEELDKKNIDIDINVEFEKDKIYIKKNDYIFDHPLFFKIQDNFSNKYRGSSI